MLYFPMLSCRSTSVNKARQTPNMLYRPKFCSNCGEKIERAEWNILTSRRFCDVCTIENKGHEWFSRAAVGLGLVAGIFGLGSFFVGTRPSDQLVPVRLAQTAEPRQNVIDPGSRVQAAPAQTVPDIAGLTAERTTKEQPRPNKSASDEPVYFCGALTKKGKPCSRRVKQKGRCWQHTGQPSVEPAPQLDVY